MNFKKIIVVADPMCSWCWGFEPELKKIEHYLNKQYLAEHRLGKTTSLSIILGGLRGANTKVWDNEFKNFLITNWHQVNKTTKQPFSYQLFEKKNFDYNTEPACRAVVSIRILEKIKKVNPSRVFKLFYALQKAFYQESKDITNSKIIADIAAKIGIEKDNFLDCFNSKKAKEQTQMDFQKAREMGVNSFPSLIFIDSKQNQSVLAGCQQFEKIKPFL